MENVVIVVSRYRRFDHQWVWSVWCNGAVVVLGSPDVEAAFGRADALYESARSATLTYWDEEGLCETAIVSQVPA